MKKLILVVTLIAAEAMLLIAIQDHDPCHVFGRTLCPWCPCYDTAKKVVWINKRTSLSMEGQIAR